MAGLVSALYAFCLLFFAGLAQAQTPSIEATVVVTPASDAPIMLEPALLNWPCLGGVCSGGAGGLPKGGGSMLCSRAIASRGCSTTQPQLGRGLHPQHVLQQRFLRSDLWRHLLEVP